MLQPIQNLIVTTIKYVMVLAMILTLSPVSAQIIKPFPLMVGVRVEGNLDDQNPIVRYTFEADAAAEITLTMEGTSGNLDPFLTLLDPDGLPLAQNDDRATGVRSAQIQATLPTDGVYIVEATRLARENSTELGTYQLLLEIEGVETPVAAVDPLSQPPNFGVAFTSINYQEFGADVLTVDNPRQYYAVGGDRGDLVRAILTTTDENLTARVNILNSELSVISESLRPRESEMIAFTTLPRRDWYLIEVVLEEGSGNFSLYVDGVAGQIIDYNSDSVIGQFTVNTPSASYTFNGSIGDQLFISAATRGGGAAPRVRLLDISRREIAQAEGERFTTLPSVSLPRTGTYILQVENTRQGTEGNYSLRLNAVEASASDLVSIPAEYNTAYKGTIRTNNIAEIYTFAGKTGEVITAEMTALDTSQLDPLLILMDANLNELAENDNSRGTRNARIAQFSLPADGDYYLLAGRSGLRFGVSSGEYDLDLSAGSISLRSGPLTASVSWNGDDDLNLFIREPSGRVISWSNPDTPDSGTLQIDSNTNCETITAQPVEHIYWEPDNFPVNGDYEVWVWYQNICQKPDSTDFNFNLKVNDVVILEKQQSLEAGERFNVDIRVSDPEVFILDDGRITRPSPQQRASEGGDIPILYGQDVTNSIDGQIYARFYQFFGEEGDEVTITIDRLTGNLDPFLILRDDNETNLAENDDVSDDNKNSQIDNYTLPYTGRYVIAVTRFGVREGTTVGDFRLTLRSNSGY